MTQNEKRAARARVALRAYGQTAYVAPDALVRDLLADLMHQCAHKGVDFDEELSAARDNFTAE